MGCRISFPLVPRASKNEEVDQQWWQQSKVNDMIAKRSHKAREEGGDREGYHQFLSPAVFTLPAVWLF